MTIPVLVDQRLFPGSGMELYERGLLASSPDFISLTKLDVSGKLGHPLSCYRIAQSIHKHLSANPGLARNAVFYSAAFVPPGYSAIPAVVTVHDLIHLHYYDRFRREYYNIVFRPLYRRCAAIVTVSEATKAELCRWSGIDQSKVHVIHSFCRVEFVNNGQKKDLGFKYIFSPRNHMPYKNTSTLFKSYAASGLSNEGVHLVLTGEEKPEWIETIDQLRIRPFIHFLGFVPEPDMPRIYKGAEAVSYISLYEGFGLPIIEAMASGAPVVTSNVTAMPEIAGNAALVVDPLNVAQVADALRKVVCDPDLRASLIQKGDERNKVFQSEQSAQKLWALIAEVGKAAPRRRAA